RLTRGSGGSGAPTSGTAKNASRGSSGGARRLRGLTFADQEPPTLSAALLLPLFGQQLPNPRPHPPYSSIDLAAEAVLRPRFIISAAPYCAPGGRTAIYGHQGR